MTAYHDIGPRQAISRRLLDQRLLELIHAKPGVSQWTLYALLDCVDQRDPLRMDVALGLRRLVERGLITSCGVDGASMTYRHHIALRHELSLTAGARITAAA